MDNVEDYERWKLERQSQSIDKQSYMERFGITERKPAETSTKSDWIEAALIVLAVAWLLVWFIRNRRAVAYNAENFIVAMGALAIKTGRGIYAGALRIIRKAKERADQ